MRIPTFFLLFIILTFTLRGSISYGNDEQLNPIYQLSIAELMQVKITQPATLTKTTRRLIPASVTTITAENIRRSSARSMNELLEIYVPGLQVIDHAFGFSHIGMRGIMSDRDDKYLMLVNGRTLNERTVVGAISERDLVMLGDIHHIEVIRGSGSATYGLGAVAMVINIVTYDGSNFQGKESRTKIGFAEDYVSQEFKVGHKTDDDHYFFLYGGIADYRGAEHNDAPLRFSTSGTTRAGDTILAEKDASFDTGRDKEQYRDIPPLKFHGQLKINDWNLWLRYTRGGKKKPPNNGHIFTPPIGDNRIIFTDENKPYPPNQLGYQQLVATSEYHQVVNIDWSIDYMLSYDLLDWERDLKRGISPAAIKTQSHREDEFFARALAHWEPKTEHSVAIGIETSHEKFGLRSPGFPDNPAEIPGLPAPAPDWSTNTYSLLFEHQWNINQNWTSFISARIDDHTYTDTLFSPRLSIIFTPTKSDTLKLITGRSQRMIFAVDMRKDFQNNDITDSEPETLDSIELLWEHRFTDQLQTAVVLYEEKLDLIGLTLVGVEGQSVIAEEEQWGAEFELTWQSDNFNIELSHTYTKLLEFDLREGITQSFITTKPNGFGNDLTNWSNNLTKLNGQYQLNEHWSLQGSIVYYWYFEGNKDKLEFRASNGSLRWNEGRDQIYDRNLYLNLGAEYQLNNEMTLGITGHNLLGLVSKTYNKRNYLNPEGEYRLQASALSTTLNWRFD